MPKKFMIKKEVSIWKRGFAFLIDLLIIEFIVNLNFSKFLEQELSNNKTLVELFNYGLENYSSLEPRLLMISIITAISALIYFTLMEFYLKQTIGKIMLKIKISYQNKLEFWQALVRNIPKVAFFVNYTVWIFLIDLIYHSFTKKRLFDKLARTDVEKVN